MVIDIRKLLLWKAEEDLFLAWIDNRMYHVSKAENRIARIKTGIGFN